MECRWSEMKLDRAASEQEYGIITLPATTHLSGSEAVLVLLGCAIGFAVCPAIIVSSCNGFAARTSSSCDRNDHSAGRWPPFYRICGDDCSDGSLVQIETLEGFPKTS